jgi:hypothetical protein
MMIDSLTGMKPGERYTVESLERTRHFPGFFLDGKYYLGPELMTAVGWLEGQHFFYDELDPTGEPVFPDRLAGRIEDLTLVLADGARLKLNKVRFNAPLDSPSPAGGRRDNERRPSLLAAVCASLLLGGCLYALSRRGRRERLRPPIR